MVFSSLQFIFLFLPVALAAYYLLNSKLRNVFLLLAGLLFYAWGEPRFLVIMVVLCIANWLLGLAIYSSRNKKGLKVFIFVIGLVVDIGILFVYKYLNFFTSTISGFTSIAVTSIAMPIGISFFTFKMISYLVDVFKAPEKVCKNPLNLSLYFSFFPQIMAGPITRYDEFIGQVKNRKENITLVGEGIERFILGLAKKVIIANNLSIAVDKAFGLNSSELSAGFAWFAAICYTLQIYFDFSGYSDMALGLGKMFGFQFGENFNYPYIAKNVTDFWRRWHISLSSWFRDYVYLPMGGDGRNSKHKTFAGIRNLFIIWLLTGIWHGAYWTFIIWGLVYFVLLLLEKYLIKPEKRKTVVRVLYRIFTLLAVCLLWVVFRSPSFEGLSTIFKALTFQNSVVFDDLFRFYAREYLVYFIIAIVACLPIVPWLKAKTEDITKKASANVMLIVRGIVLLALLVIAVSYLVMGNNNPFIYFNF